MLRDVVAVEVAGPHRLRLTFGDGVAGAIDVARPLAFESVFAGLAGDCQRAADCQEYRVRSMG